MVLGLFGAFLTAYYTFRVIFVMLFPPGRTRRVYESKVPTGHYRPRVQDESTGMTTHMGTGRR